MPSRNRTRVRAALTPLGPRGAEVLQGDPIPMSTVQSHSGEPGSKSGFNPVTALVVGIHRLATEAMSVALAQQGFAPQLAYTPSEAVRAAKATRPNLALLDMGGSNTENTRVGLHILAESPDTKIIVITDVGQPDEVAEVMRAGFHGWVTKQTPLINLLAALASSLDGEPVVLRSSAEAGLPRSSQETHPVKMAKQLTAREWDVLKLLARGFSNRDIGLRLSISPNTVRAHVQAILAKFEVHSRLEAVTFAARNRLVDIRESEELLKA